jgi:hypothetical protein
MRRGGHTWKMRSSLGLGEDRTNGAAARPVVAAREGRAREESPREGKGLTEGGDDPEALSGEREGLSTSRARAGGSRAEVDLSPRCLRFGFRY